MVSLLKKLKNGELKVFREMKKENIDLEEPVFFYNGKLKNILIPTKNEGWILLPGSNSYPYSSKLIKFKEGKDSFYIGYFFDSKGENIGGHTYFAKPRIYYLSEEKGFRSISDNPYVYEDNGEINMFLKKLKEKDIPGSTGTSFEDKLKKLGLYDAVNSKK
jgi:hypothetical protein